MEKIAIKAADLQQTFDKFRQLQTEGDGSVPTADKLELLKRKQGISLQALQEARDRVLAARSSPAYPRILRRLAEEALGLAGGSDLVLHVDPRDKILLEKILRDLQRNSEVVADLESAGGLTIASRDGRFLVTNTLESRLSRARELLKGEVFTILYGG